MKGYLLPFLMLAATMAGSGCSETGIKMISSLEHAIESRLSETEGDFAVAFRLIDNSDTTRSIFLNEREMFHAASTMKTPVMIELFRQAAEGRFNLSDSIPVKNEFRSIVDSSRYRMDIEDDSGDDLYGYIGRQRTIRDLMRDMIAVSSNLATNILIEKVGAENVTQTMRSYGADSIRVLRGVEDIKAYEQGLSNRTTALDELIIYEKIARGEAVSREASEEIIDILKLQEFNEMIPARLPQDVQVAHKTGWITGVNHDAGIVLLPDGRRYILVLLSKNTDDREAVVDMFANISRMVYDFVDK